MKSAAENRIKGAMKIDSDAIRQLAGLLDETGLTEIEVGQGDKMIRVSRSIVTVTNTGGGQAVPAAPMPSDPAARQSANLNAPDTAPGTHPGAITSPMVGTAYLAATPGASPFVSKGASVKPGDTLVIIEAMKVMNPIKADRAGTVTQILVENGQPVEFGEVLMVIE